MTQKNIPDVSVVIINWNTKDLVIECIRSIREHTHTTKLEIIIVDNGSTDGTQLAIHKKFPGVKFIQNNENLGFAKAFFRRREGIVRHSILAIIAYAALALLMYRLGKQMTIGECCEYLRDKSNKEFVKEIVEIDNKPFRIERFEEVFI